MMSGNNQAHNAEPGRLTSSAELNAHFGILCDASLELEYAHKAHIAKIRDLQCLVILTGFVCAGIRLVLNAKDYNRSITDKIPVIFASMLLITAGLEFYSRLLKKRYSSHFEGSLERFLNQLPLQDISNTKNYIQYYFPNLMKYKFTTAMSNIAIKNVEASCRPGRFDPALCRK